MKIISLRGTGNLDADAAAQYKLPQPMKLLGVAQTLALANNDSSGTYTLRSQVSFNSIRNFGNGVAEFIIDEVWLRQYVALQGTDAGPTQLGKEISTSRMFPKPVALMSGTIIYLHREITGVIISGNQLAHLYFE